MKDLTSYLLAAALYIFAAFSLSKGVEHLSTRAVAPVLTEFDSLYQSLTR